MSILIDPHRAMRNRLLALLPGEAYKRLAPSLEIVPLRIKQILYAPNAPIPYVYFPLHTVLSLIVLLQDGQAVEVATIGNEGMVGLPVFLGAETISGQAFTQIPGEAVRIEAKAFREEATRAGPLQDVMRRYTQAMFTQISQSVACNHFHKIDQRCARWLLMTEDRVGQDQFPLTQEFLSLMLGTRRAGVSEAASRLQKEGLIQYSRGVITVLDRQGLEMASCECYEIIKQEYERLLG